MWPSRTPLNTAEGPWPSERVGTPGKRVLGCLWGSTVCAFGLLCKGVGACECMALVKVNESVYVCACVCVTECGCE